MKAIRYVAVGLLISVALMVELWVPFMRWWIKTSDDFAFSLAIDGITKGLSNMAGFHVMSPVVFIIFCIGIGLLLSTTVYAKLENIVSGILTAFLLRKKKTDYAVHMRAKYFGWLFNRS